MPRPAANRFSFFDDLAALDSGTSLSHNQKELSPTGLSSSYSHQPSNLGPVPASVNEETDEWGEFEDATSPKTVLPSSVNLTDSPWEVLQSLKPTTKLNALLYNSNQDASTNRHDLTTDPFRFGSLPAKQASPNVCRPVADALPKRDPNVLFDVNQPDDEDDFGDFEAPTPEEAVRTRNSKRRGLKTDAFSRSPSCFSGSSNVFDGSGMQGISRTQKLTSIPSAHITKLAASRSSPTSPHQAQIEDAPWGDFTDWEESLPTSGTNETSAGISSIPPVLKGAVEYSSLRLAQVAPDELPPTNVPPPGILLTLFLSLFSEAQTKLFKPIATQTYQTKNKLLSDPAILSFLRGYLMIATVAARIIAGRKLRWKRDMHLAQGMKLGPASSRGTSGMKLTGVDKSEINKEEREVLDVVRAWREQLGRLRSAVAAVNVIHPGYLGTIPEIQDVMAVRAYKESDGGIPAPQQCALCGLRRDERVNKVDVSVEDSFGEWWIEQVSMHRACRNFWQQHKEGLRQR